jgi:hypothetical protein
VGIVGDADTAAVGFHNCFNQIETQTNAILLFTTGIETYKTAKKIVAFGRRNTGPTISHSHANCIRLRGQLQLQRFAEGTVFAGVDEQIENYLC